ncbi:MAG: hypothetical protein IKC60_04135 [Clostridia bacterium]|nr:hypothetical protein [Clostridia bacterium]
MKHGIGRYVWKSGPSAGSVYEGEWFEDERTGMGIHSWKSGAVYEGGYLKGKYHGMGKYTFPTGDCFEGEFSHGEEVKGVIRDREGNIIKRIG